MTGKGKLKHRFCRKLILLNQQNADEKHLYRSSFAYFIDCLKHENFIIDNQLSVDWIAKLLAVYFNYN